MRLKIEHGHKLSMTYIDLLFMPCLKHWALTAVLQGEVCIVKLLFPKLMPLNMGARLNMICGLFDQDKCY